ncbi:MAG: GNAT family N-acetyltransferase [Actinomycetales bacterium]
MSGQSPPATHVTQEWRIRDAEPGDVARIAEMVRELATYEKEVDQVESTAESFAELMFPADGRTPMAFCLLADVKAEDGEWRSVGFAAWYVTFSTWTGQNGIWLEDLFVAPDARGLGLGKALLARLAQIAIERRYSRVEWWVLRWNEPALGFYQRLGAHDLDEWVHYRIDRDELQALGS